MNDSKYSFTETDIEGCKIYQAKKIHDDRGYFSEIFSRPLYYNTVAQINCSFSKKNVFRGIHEASFGKLVSCVKGRIIDYCVDLRKASQTYGHIVSVELSEDNFKQLYIPPNCGHGFYAFENSLVVYSQTDTWSKLKEKTHCYKDLYISLPAEKPILSKKDKC